MSLVKWFRRNNKKVMAVVVIVIMFGFVGGSYLSQLGRARSNPRRTWAYFLDNNKITNSNMRSAQAELSLLKSLQIDRLLLGWDIQGILLSELLFTEQRPQPTLINHLRRTISTSQYRIGIEEIADFYERSIPGNALYWLLLKNEARLAGIRISDEDVRKVLEGMIPKLFEGMTYSRRIGLMINAGITEEQVLTTFGDLLSVLEYAHLVCSNEAVTTRQIMHTASQEEEIIDIEFVRFDSELFNRAELGVREPNDERIAEHFDKYKGLYSHTAAEDNPYAFGYKLPDRVRLEYIAVKLDDISTIITEPTYTETEEYYRRNKGLFTEQIPPDPNNPNSALTERTKSYAEVVDTITELLLRKKIDTKAERILQDAKALTEPNLAGTDLKLEELTAEQLEEMAGDYKIAAERLSKKHNVKIYIGQTGLLNPIDMQTDVHFSRLSIPGYGYYPVSLTQVIFAIDQLRVVKLNLFDAPKPRMYENIGPARDPFGFYRGPLAEDSEEIMAIVRVTEAIKASQPQSIEETFSTRALNLDPNEDTDGPQGPWRGNDVYSVREKVVEDLKKLAAMDVANAKAKEFIELATKDDWQSALDKFNELYGQEAKQEPNDPNVFIIENSTLRRTSSLQLAMLAVQNQGDPAAKFILNEAKLNREFTDELYSLVPPDSNTAETLPLVVEFKPAMSVFCIKALSVKRLWKEDFDQIKARRLYRQDHIQSQSLAPIHFNADNILKRMKFRTVDDETVSDEKPEDVNAPQESEAPA